jgi:hypothetical protein
MKQMKQTQDSEDSKGRKPIQWKNKMPATEPLQAEKILDKRVKKKSRGKEYFEYLVKWKDHPIEDSTWMTSTLLHKSGNTIIILMDRSP